MSCENCQSHNRLRFRFEIHLCAVLPQDISPQRSTRLQPTTSAKDTRGLALAGACPKRRMHPRSRWRRGVRVFLVGKDGRSSSRAARPRTDTCAGNYPQVMRRGSPVTCNRSFLRNHHGQSRRRRRLEAGKGFYQLTRGTHTKPTEVAAAQVWKSTFIRPVYRSRSNSQSCMMKSPL